MGRNRGWRAFAPWLLLFLAILLPVAECIRQLSVYPSPEFLYDDSYMFARYARHILAGHGAVWNVGGPRTYGCTSPAFLAWTTVVLAAVPNAATALALGSTTMGLVFIGCSVWMVREAFPSRPTGALVAAAVALILTYLRLRTVGGVWMSGMDTTLASAWIGAWAALFLRFVRTQSRPAAIVCGILAGLSFWVRPELVVVTVGVTGLYWLLGRTRSDLAGTALISCAASLALVFALNPALFGTALPLPFYAKVALRPEDFDTRHYDATRGWRVRPFLITVAMPLCLALLATGLYRPKLQASFATLFGVLSLALGLVIHFQVTQIMGYWGRFYWPLLPAAILAGSWAILALWDRFGELIPSGLVLPAGLIFVAFAGHQPLLWLLRGAQGPGVSMSAWANYRDHRQNLWVGLDEIAALPASVRIATTEVGHVGEMAQEHWVLDLAGLNDARLATRPRSVVDVLLQDRIDVVYLPHRDYRALQGQLQSDPRFRSRYRIWSAKEVGAELGIAVLRQSAAYGKVVEIVERRARPGTDVIFSPKIY